MATRGVSCDSHIRGVSIDGLTRGVSCDSSSCGVSCHADLPVSAACSCALELLPNPLHRPGASGGERRRHRRWVRNQLIVRMPPSADEVMQAQQKAAERVQQDVRRQEKVAAERGSGRLGQQLCGVSRIRNMSMVCSSGHWVDSLG